MAQVENPTPLRKFTGGAEGVEAEGATVAALVADLETRYPGHQGAHLRRDGQGAALRQHLRQRRGHPLPRSNLDTPVKDGDEISIVPPSPAGAEPPHDAHVVRAPSATGGAAATGPLAAPSRPRADRQHAAGRDPRASRDGVPPGVRIYAKLEGFNPGGSVKDRAALKMVAATASRSGALRARQDHPRLDLGQHRHRARDDRRRARLSGRAGDAGERQHRAQEDHRAPSARRSSSASPLEGSDGAIRLCREDPRRATRRRYFKPDQYNNEANPLAHYETTGPGDLAADRRRASRTSSPASAPAARSWAPAAT